jgi:hypothetical protein
MNHMGERRKQRRGGDEQGRPGAYRWAPPEAAAAGKPPSAHARGGSGGVEGRLGRAPAGRPKTGWVARGERRGKRPRLGRAPGWAAPRLGQEKGASFSIFLFSYYPLYL